MTRRPGPTLVVLAAGSSTRFGSPKQLVAVGPAGEALLDYALFDAARAGFRTVVLVVGGEAEPRFRAHVADVVGKGIPVRFVAQVPPATRQKPWGTGHAVLAAAPAVHGPFAVCNADDFYGASAYRQLFEHLMSRAPGSSEYAMVAYRLSATLSPHGGVSRALVQQDASGYLVHLTELPDVARAPSGIRGSGPDGTPVTVDGDQPVSMNLWGFLPAVFPVLQLQFHAFLAQHGSDPTVEFQLSEAMSAQVASGVARVQVLAAQDNWCGLTVAADTAVVRQAIRALVAGGGYPRDLRAGFNDLPGHSSAADT